MPPIEEGGAKALSTGEQQADRVEEVVDVGPDLGEDLALVHQLAIDARLDALAQVGLVERAGHGVLRDGRSRV